MRGFHCPTVSATVLSSVFFLAAIPAWAQFGESRFGGLAGLGPGVDDPVVSVDAQFTLPEPDRPARLFVRATIKPKWHIYSITQAAGGPVPTKIKLEPSDAYQLRGEYQVSPPPDKKPEPVFDNLVVESHHGTVVWYAPLEFSPGVDPKTRKIKGSLFAQPCDASSCLPPQSFPFTASVGPGLELPEGEPAAAPAPSQPPQRAVAYPSAPSRAERHYELPWQPFTTVAAFQELTGSFDAEEVRNNLGERLGGASLDQVLWWSLIGFLGGIILNVMPCVLPVIGLKIFSFIEQAGHDRRKAFFLNVWYSLGLLSVFLVLATLAAFGGLGWGQQFSSKAFSIALAAVVFVMGLSFLGVWEIPIPGFVGRGKASELAEKEGPTGAVLKGMLTTILATPCSAPFLAPALTWAFAQPPMLTYAVFVSAGLGMASPYLVIGAFPELIRFLPKPGPWMETFKHVMGFVLLGTVVFILTFLELPYVVPTVALLFGLWAACWWIGRLSPTAGFGTKIRTWMEAAAFAGAVWIVAFPGIDDILPGRYSFGGLADVMQRRYHRAVQTEVALALPQGNRGGRRTVLVDFTADWCLTCKTLEATVLNTPAVRQAIERYGVVTLQADWTRGDPEVTAMLELLGSKQVPVVAIFPAGNPNNPIVFRGGYTQQMLLDALQQAEASKRAS